MVQFQHESKPQISDYWKLDSGTKRFQNTKNAILRVLTPNDQYLKSKSIARIRELYIRHQRGLLSYERLTARELKSFVKQRGLTPTLTKKPSLAILRAQLEQADDDATFDRLFNLPPELREQIFKQYFASFDNSRGDLLEDALEPGCQPPITLVSKQIRLEALPLFYSHFLFRFGVHRFVSEWLSQPFIRNTPASNFARIRFLDLSGFYHVYRDTGYFIGFSISLDDDVCSTKVSEIDPRSNNKNKDDMEAIAHNLNQILMLKPHTFVRGIAARTGMQKLQKTDMPELHDRLLSAVRELRSMQSF